MNPPKDFVGRQKELKEALHILGSGKSLIIDGRFGIGKTTFAKKVAAEFGTTAVYCSFEDNALKMIDDLNRQLIKYYRPGGARLGTQVQKFLKAADGKKVLVIIDDVWKVTIQKVRFFKRLNENLNCLFIIVSEIKNKSALTMVKGICWNNVTISLSKLNHAESLELFERRFRAINKNVELLSHRKLVESCKGYPPNIIEATQVLAHMKNQIVKAD